MITFQDNNNKTWVITSQQKWWECERWLESTARKKLRILHPEKISFKYKGRKTFFQAKNEIIHHQQTCTRGNTKGISSDIMTENDLEWKP